MGAVKTAKLVGGTAMNVLVLPGIGTLMLGRKREGWIQIITCLAGLVLSVWGLVVFSTWAMESAGITGDLSAALKNPEVMESLRAKMNETPALVMGLPASLVALAGYVLVGFSWFYSIVSVWREKSRVPSPEIPPSSKEQAE